MKNQNKFNARKVKYKDMIFDSKKEFERYLVLADMAKNKKIKKLKRQQEYLLLAPNEVFDGIIYRADFVYEQNKEIIVEDVKGLRKGSAYQLFKIKQKLMYKVHNIIVKEI